MNKNVLQGVTVCQGHSYANDALQGILTDMIPLDHNTIFHGNPDSKEYKKAEKNLRLFTDMFDTIVGKGKEYALEFIKNNWSIYTQSPWEEEINDQELASHETNENLEQS